MSREIDERVVQMSLENGQFERAAKQSLETVEKIKKDTDLSGAARAIRNSGMVEAVQHISNAFTSFGGILKRKIFDQLADQIISSAKNMFRQIEIEPITQGFQEYELKMGSVQTIMSSTGATVEEVNKYLDELNEYADRTIYSFSDMTNNIGKFTNAGVKLDDAVLAIKGVSNAAALAGSNATQASHAMYNIAQALSTGYVQLIDWKSIADIAGLGTKDFREELIATAESLGTIKKQSDGTYKSTQKSTKQTFTAMTGFRDSLRDQWLTTDVLIQTLARYSDETTDLGKKAYAAAQDVKTFTQMIDTLKEASGSGWAETWQIIFGDFEEAKTLWTGVNNVISAMIDNQSKSRNAMLQQWKDLGGRTLAIEALADAFDVLRGFVMAAKEGFMEFFPALTGEKLFSWTEKFRSFIAEIKEALPFIYESGETITGTGDQVYRTNRKYFKFEGVMLSVYKIFNGLGAAASIAGKAIGTIGSLLMDLVRYSLPGGEGVLAWLGTIGDRIANLRDELEENDFFARWKQKVVDAIAPTGENITALGEKFKTFFSTIKTSFDESGIGDKVVEGIRTFANDVVAAMPGVITTITDFVSRALEFLQTNETVQKIVGKVRDFAIDLTDKIPTLYADVVDFVKGLLGFGDESETLSTRFDKLVQSIKDFVHELLDYDENGASIIDRFVNDMFPKLTEEGEEVTDKALNPFTDLFNKFGEKTENIKDALNDLGANIGSGINWIMSKWTEYDIDGIIGKVFAFWAGSNFVKLMGSFTKLNTSLAKGIGGFGTIIESVVRNIDKTGDGAKGVFDSIAQVFSKFWENMTGMSKDWTDVFRKKDTPATALLKAAGAIVLLVAAVYVLTKIDDQAFKNGAIKLGSLAVGLLIFTGIFNAMSRGIDIKDLGSQIKKMAVGVILLVGAIWLLSGMDTNGLLKGVFFLGIILAELGGFMQLTKGGGFAKDTSPKFISLAISLILMVQTLKQLSAMSIESLAKSIIALGVILFELGVFTKLAGMNKDTKMASFFGLAFTLLSIIGVLKQIADMDPSELFISLIGLGLILTELGLFSRLASKEFGFGTGIAFLGLAVSLVALVGVIKQIAEMDAGDLAKGLGVVTIMLALITIVSREMGQGVSISKSIGLLIVMVGAIAAFFEVLYLLKDYPPRQLLSISASFGLMMGGIGVIILALSKLPTANLGTALANIGIIVGLLLGVGGVLTAIDHYFNGAATKTLKSMAEPMQSLGEALGAFFGGIIGGAGDAIMSKLPAMGNYLGKFMENAKSFFEGVKDIDGQTFLGGEALALVLASISGAEIVEGVARIINFGKSSMETFSTDVVELGKGIAGFAKEIDGVNTDKVTAAANAADVIAKLNSALPPRNGRLQEWFGEKSLGRFSIELGILGAGIAAFAWLTKGVDDDKLKATGNAVGVLANLNTLVPYTGGFLQILIGQQSIGAFGNNLWNLGIGIAKFSWAMKLTRQEDLNKGLTAVDILGKFAASLPEYSIFDIFTGGDLDNFTRGLPGLGSAIGTFAKELKGTGATPEEIEAAGTAADLITSFASKLGTSIEGSTAFISVIRSANGLGTFATNLKLFGENLLSFKTNTAGIKDNTFDGAIGAATAIATFADIDLKGRSLSEILGQFITGQSEMESFGSGIAAMGTGLAGMYSAVSDIKDWSSIDTALTYLTKVGNLVSTYTDDIGGWGTEISLAGDAMANLDTIGIKEMLEGLVGVGTGPYVLGTTAAETLAEGFTEGINQIPQLTAKIAYDAGTELINSFSQTGYAVYQMGIVIGNNLKSGLSYPDYYQTGKDAGAGFVAGVYAYRESAYNAGAALGSAAIAGNKTRIRSASPSKEFMKLGSYSGEGYVIGLNDWADRAETSGSKIATNALLGAKTALGYLYSILNDSIDLQPVIRPVVDTTGIAMGSAQIGNMLANSAYPIRGFAAPMTPQVSYLGGFENIEALSRSNQNVVNAVNALGNRIDDLGSRIANLKMVTDTGKLAGEMREQIDTNLGVINFRKGRRN